MSEFDEPSDDVRELNAQLGEDTDEPAGGPGEPQEPSPAPAAPQQVPPAQAPPGPAAAPWQGHPNEALIQHLPAGLKRGIAAGQMTPEEALNRHFGGRKWNNLIQGETRYQQEIATLTQRNQAAAGRLEALFRHFGETLGLELPPELQPPAPPAPPDPVAQLGQKVDQVLALEEERRIDSVVDQVDQWSKGQVQEMRQAEPEFDSANQWVVDRLIETHTQQAANAAMMFGETKDQRYLQLFDPGELRLFANGEITEEELITRAGIAASMDFAARIQQQHFDQRGNVGEYILDLARRSGWRPSREGGGQPVMAQPTPANGKPPARTPAPARPDPRLDDMRRRGTWGTPAPAGTAPGRTPRDMADAFLAMDQLTFERMMGELVAAGKDPDEAFEHLMRLSGVAS